MQKKYLMHTTQTTAMKTSHSSGRCTVQSKFPLFSWSLQVRGEQKHAYKMIIWGISKPSQGCRQGTVGTRRREFSLPGGAWEGSRMQLSLEEWGGICHTRSREHSGCLCMELRSSAVLPGGRAGRQAGQQELRFLKKGRRSKDFRLQAEKLGCES